MKAMKGFWMLVLLTISLWPASLVEAQQQDLSFVQARLPGGSSSNVVAGVAQDSQGFLWLATRAGLIRYDGYETTSYRHDPQDATSLAASKWVETVFVDRAGTLWVGTYGGGLDRFHPATETFFHFAHDPTDPTSLSGDTVTVILEDLDDNLWVGTHQGLNRMDRETGTFTRFRHDPGDSTSLSNDQVRTLYEDARGTLWIGTGSPWGSESASGAGGLNRFDPETETFSRYFYDPASPSSLIGSHVTALFEDSRGTFWVGTSGDGLHSMDRQTGTFTRHLYDPTDPGRLSMPHLDEFTGPAYVSVVHEDRFGALWIGAMNGGLSRYDPATGRLVHYEGTPGSLGSTMVSGIFESGEGVRWVITFDGLFKIVRRRSALRRHTLAASDEDGVNLVTAFLEDRKGAFWVGTEADGLSRFDESDAAWPANGRIEPTRRYLHTPGDPHSLSDDNVLSLYEGREGEIWVGTTTGLNRMDPETGRFTRYQYDPADPSSLGSGPVFSICEDRRGVLWVGIFGGGLSRFDPKTGRFTRYLHDPDRPNSLSDNDVVAVHEDREGMLWIGTLRGGINRFDPRLGRFMRYPYTVADSTGLNDGFITSIYEGDGGTLWIGTYNGGLNRLDPSTGHFTHFTTTNSTLPDDRVNGILGDAEGHLWMRTGKGTDSRLTRFAPEQNTFYTYDLDLVFPSGLTIPGTYERSSDVFFFGGNNGFIAFSPEEVVRNTPPNPHPPQVAITGLRLFDRPVEPGPDAPLKAVLSETEAVRLPHDQNTFSLDFVGLHFEDPAENRYAYMLEGYDDTWRPAGAERRAGYYKVPPGQYVFRVKAANSDGVWNEEGVSVKLTVLPPWWRTVWAYLGYVLLFIGGIVVVDRLQRRRLLEGERRRAAIREAELRTEVAEAQTHYLEALDQAKSRFFANISHEFRTPLTLLLVPLQDALGHDDPNQASERLMQQVPSMHRNAGRLLRLVGQLLDLTKLEAGSMVLHPRQLDIVAYLRTLVLAFAPRAERDGLTLLFDTEEKVLWGSVDPDNLEKIVTNLLSNATKFTMRGGKIRVGLMMASDGADFILTVSDTGRGIPADELPHVFDRFYQVDSTTTREHEGTGIGLAIVKELVALHQGTISVESKRGFGTTFRVQLPMEARSVKSSTATDQKTSNELSSPAALEIPSLEAAPSGWETSSEEARVVTTEGTVLVVDDNADVRALVRIHLEAHFHVLEAADGETGLALIHLHHPDLVISDVMMPKLDGYGLCRAVRADESLRHIPVILLTARAEEADRIHGLEGGADDYLIKPFSMRELEVRVTNLILSRSHLRDQYSGMVQFPLADVVIPSGDEAFMQQVLEVMGRHLSDSNFSTDLLAGEIGLSRRQVERKVKTLTKLTPPELMQQMRLERAAQILQARPGSIAEVAYAVGFKSPAHFSVIFRKTYGHTPSEHIG